MSANLNNAKILFLEDDANINRRVSEVLVKNGYDVDSYHYGVDAHVSLLKNCYDLILLDFFVSDMTGIELFRNIRASGINSPVIFISANLSEADIINTYRTGAVDYIKKPFYMSELLFKIKLILNSTFSAVERIQLDKNTFYDPHGRVLLSDNQVVHLTPKEFKIFELLVNNIGRIVSYDRIIDYAWDNEYVSMDSMRFIVKNLRRKLDTDLLVSHYSIGYELKKYFTEESSD
jgi:DNA-binding response OmpR family regulator